MNKKEYLEKIREALSEVSVEQGIIDEVISDYEEHFRMGIKNNKTEEEICVELGSVEEIVAEISSMGATNQPSNESKKEDDRATNTFAVSEASREQEKDSSSQAPFTKVQVDGICADIIVVNGDAFKADYINNGNEKDKLAYQFYHYQEGDTFFVGIKENFRKMLFRVFHTSDMRLVVKIPSFVEEVRVKVASGDCKVEGIKLRSIDIYSASGDITMNQAICEEANLHSSSGDLRVENSNVDTLYTKTLSGDVQVMYTNSKFIRCNSSSGDVEVNGGNIDKVEAQSTSGDVKSYTISKDYFLKSISGDVSVRMQGDGEANYETISGDISIRLNNNQNGYELNANTVSGDVSIGYMGMNQSNCKSGHYTFGNQASKIYAKTVSGDIDLKS
jgi:DUF4097 and DUF4098 domain-containing protein YvlB